MMVCAHGNVLEYCESHGFTVCEEYSGNLNDYDGNCRVIITDLDVSLQEFLYLKMSLSSKGYDVYSTRYEVTKEINELMTYIGARERSRRKNTFGGRQAFGFVRQGGEVIENPEMMAVARRVIELRDSGSTLRQIADSPEIHHLDGRKISVSTIQQIIKNRARYE